MWCDVMWCDVCMYVCMNVCMFVCMYVCMCVCVCVYTLCQKLCCAPIIVAFIVLVRISISTSKNFSWIPQPFTLKLRRFFLSHVLKSRCIRVQRTSCCCQSQSRQVNRIVFDFVYLRCSWFFLMQNGSIYQFAILAQSFRDVVFYFCNASVRSDFSITGSKHHWCYASFYLSLICA